MTQHDERVLARLKTGYRLTKSRSVAKRWYWVSGPFIVIAGRGVHRATVDRLIDAGLLVLSPDRLEARLR